MKILFAFPRPSDSNTPQARLVFAFWLSMAVPTERENRAVGSTGQEGTPLHRFVGLDNPVNNILCADGAFWFGYWNDC